MTTPSTHIDERRRLLEQRRAALATGASTPSGARAGTQSDWPPLVPRGAGEPIPMSFGHELLWTLESTSPGTHDYNVPRAIRLRGRLDMDALQRALDALIARHEVLRSTFDRVDGEPRQIVHAAHSLTIQRVDLRGVRPFESREAAAAAEVRRLARRPYDLTRDFPVRGTIISIGDDDQIFLWESHHVASDGWSRNILFDELARAYEACVTGRDVELPPVGLQYGDFAVWQRKALRGERLDTLVSYWRGQLAGAPSDLALPTDRPRTPHVGSAGAMATRILPRPLLDALLALSRERGATLFMTLLAAFDVLLSRYTRQDDIVVGSPMAGRSLDGVERIVGYIADTLVLRTRLDGDPTFLELLSRVRQVALDAYDHQALPYEKLVFELAETSRDLRAPLFRTVFTLHDAEQRPFGLHGLTTVPFTAHSGATKFDLALFASQRPDGLRTAIEYRTELFDAATIDRMLRHLQVILEAIVHDPNVPVSQIRLLDADERALIESWSAPGPAYPRDSTVPELFRDVVRDRPDAVAVIQGGASMTYAQLDRASDAIAADLRASGVTTGTLVGICLSRSPALVSAVLGVLKAGAAYVPLDPGYPVDRLRFMVVDTGAPVVLAERALEHVVTAMISGEATSQDHAQTRVIYLDEIPRSASARLPSAGSGALPTCALPSCAPSSAAYVMYTSGSTGRPKGVVIPHRAIVRLACGAQHRAGRAERRQYVAITPDDVVLGVAPIAFDASTFELWAPLLAGARIALARAGAVGLDELAATVERHRVTVMWLTAGLFQQVVEHARTSVRGFSAFSTVRAWLAGGDVLPPATVAAVQNALAGCTVINGYGPTENTTFTCCYPIPRGWDGAASVPIGRPIPHTTVRILDVHGMPVPIGIPGELCTGGDGLALGYLNHPTLTAERFITHGDGERLYRTGDSARWRADGTVEFLGRLDQQVKIRGFRVEPGEVEVVLRLCPLLRDVAVVAHESASGETQLVAYFVSASRDGGRDLDELRTYTRAHLPSYMVPAAFVPLDEIPLTPVGKVDRRALPVVGPDDVAPAVAPRSALELRIAEIWCEVLKRHTVGVTDRLLDIGGHSLAAMRIAARMRDAFGRQVTLQSLFDRPTIAELAEMIDAAGKASEVPAHAGIIQRAARGAFRKPLSPPPRVGAPGSDTFGPG